MLTSLAFLQTLRLASPALPVGAFAWSTGLEGAIAEGRVTPQSASSFIRDSLLLAQARWDAPVLWRMAHSDDLHPWNAEYLASRETRELRMETLQMGGSLVKLLRDLGHAQASPPHPTFPCAWALAAKAFEIPPETALLAWLMAFLENQLAVLQKALPLGQVATQRLMSQLLPVVIEAHAQAMALPDEGLSASLPGLALFSSRHETQYSRLFRS